MSAVVKGKMIKVKDQAMLPRLKIDTDKAPSEKIIHMNLLTVEIHNKNE